MKTIKKIIFIETKPPNFHIFTKSAMPRLGTILLGTTLKQHGYEVRSYIESIGELDLKDVLTADAVGISCITSTSIRSYEIADILRSAGITVFMGGPHVTFMPDEALEHCDYVMRGEVDDYILEFVKTLESGEGFENVPGLSYRQGGEVFHNKNAAYCKDMNTIPVPDFTMINGLGDKAFKKFTITPIMTSRGCPYDCSFCSVTSMFGQKYRFRDKSRVIEELERNRECGGNWVFFYDDNFMANRARTKELLREMIKRGLTPKWTAQVRVEIAKDEELLQLMKQANCYIVYIGLESINPRTLELYNKGQTVADIEKCIKILHKYGIRIHGMFVLGSDHDTTDTITETVKFAKKNNLDSVQFLILTPLPGTSLHDNFKKEGRIVSYDWSLYDAHHVVYEPKLMTYYELQSNIISAAKDFYSINQILKRAVKFDLFNVAIKTYGHRLTKMWESKNRPFVEYTRSLTKYGRTIELSAKKTAEDIKEKFKEIELSGAIVLPKSHKTT